MTKSVFPKGVAVLGTDYLEIPFGDDSQRGSPETDGASAVIRISQVTGLIEWWDRVHRVWNTPATGNAYSREAVTAAGQEVIASPGKFIEFSDASFDNVVIKLDASAYKSGETFSIQVTTPAGESSPRLANIVQDGATTLFFNGTSLSAADTTEVAMLKYVDAGNYLVTYVYIGDGRFMVKRIETRSNQWQRYSELSHNRGAVTMTAATPPGYTLQPGTVYFLDLAEGEFPNELNIADPQLNGAEPARIWLVDVNSLGDQRSPKFSAAAKTANPALGYRDDERIFSMQGDVVTIVHLNGQWRYENVHSGTLNNRYVNRDISNLTNDQENFLYPGTTFSDSVVFTNVSGISYLTQVTGYQVNDVELVTRRMSNNKIREEFHMLDLGVVAARVQNTTAYSAEMPLRANAPVSRHWVSGQDSQLGILFPSPLTTIVLNDDVTALVRAAMDENKNGWKEGDVIELINASASGKFSFRTVDTGNAIPIYDQSNTLIDTGVSENLDMPYRGVVRLQYTRVPAESILCWRVLELVYY